MSTGRCAYDQPLSVNLSAIVGSLGTADADGYYTVLLPSAYPANATMRSVAMESYFTFANAPVGLQNISPPSIIVGEGANKPTPRRQVVDVNQCLLCHERLGFHSNAGRTDNPDQCVICHNTENTSSNLFAGYVKGSPGAWVATTSADPDGFLVGEKPMNLKDLVHSLHAGCPMWIEEEGDCAEFTIRSNPFNFIRSNPNGGGGGAGVYRFSDIGYPARKTDCMSCHKAGTFAAVSVPNALWSVYGAEAGLAAAPGPSNPAAMTRVGPLTSACGSCHDSAAAQAHFQQNTSFALGAEGCDVCHGPGRSVDVEEAHSNRFN